MNKCKKCGLYFEPPVGDYAPCGHRVWGSDEIRRQHDYACDSCDFTLVDPKFLEACAVVPEVTCRCGKRMRSLGMQPGTALPDLSPTEDR